MLQFNKVFDVASDMLFDHADGHIAVAYDGKDGDLGFSCAGSGSTKLAIAISIAMNDSEHFRDAIFSGVARYIKDYGNPAQVHTPSDIQAN